MQNPSEDVASALTSKLDAPQHRPRPLPLFLDLLRRETAGDPARMRVALAGLRKYQEAPREPGPRPMPVVTERGGATLRDYGAASPDRAKAKAPLLFVPSLINPPTVLDLAEGNSMLRWLAAQGHRPLLLDWGWPDERRRSLSIAGHVEDILLPLLRALPAPPVLVGYCLGGTMAAAAAQLVPVRGLATIAAPWRFSGFPAEARDRLNALWRQSSAAADQLGLLPMEVLQSAFWSLDPARTVAKFERFAEMEDEAARSFVRLEDWSNDGPPLGAGAARELFEDFFGRDLPGSGPWRVAGRAMDPRTLTCPVLTIVATRDRIVPQATAIPAGETVEAAAGHVGMVVGRGAREALWTPLSTWVSRAAASC